MRKQLLCLVLIIIFSSQLWAQSDLDEGDFWLLGGDLFLMEKGDTQSPEIDNSGFGFGVKGVFSRYWEKWIADVGLGYRMDTMEKDDVEIETKAFYLELGARYKINRSWSIGPELHLLSGVDVSFSDTFTNSDDKPSALFLGFRVMHNQYIGKKGHILRLGAQALTDLNIADRQVNSLQFVLEYGWPCRCGKHKKKEKLQAKPIKKKRKKRLKKRAPIKLDLRNAGVRFDSGKSTLKGDSLMVIDRLAKILSKYDKEWDQIRIEGHTDITGNYDKNVELSKARAATVESEFVKRGVVQEKIGSTGYGPDKPLALEKTKAAYAKNRRVELHLMGNKASRAFVNELRRVLKSK